MRTHRVLMSACLAAIFAACNGSTPVKEYRSSSGSLAQSADGSELYAVDADNGLVAVLSGKDLSTIAQVKVGRTPERIAVAGDGSLFVTNKGDRTVSVIQRGTWQVVDSVTVGIEPGGVDVTADGEHVLVASATALDSSESGTLTSLNARTHDVEWTVPVGPEAYAVRVVPGDKAYVSLFKSGKLAVVDLKTHAVSGSVDLAGRKGSALGFGSAVAPPSTTERVAGTPNLVTDVAVSPDGERAYSTHIRARDNQVIQTQTGGGGYGGSPSQTVTCGRGPIAAPALATVDVSDNQPKTDDFESCQTGDNTDFERQDFPPNILDPNPTGADPVQGPQAVLVDPNGEFLYVANMQTSNVVVLSTARRTGSDIMGSTGVMQVVRTGEAPTGLAVSPDGKTLFVHHQFDHSVGAYRADSSGRIAEVSSLRNRYANDTLPADLVQGRRLFFSASNPVMTNLSSSISCASCHPNGREDGRVWPFPEGPRQTPALAGRNVAKTAPYHWAGEFNTINEFFDETVKRRMGGRGFQDAKDPQAKQLFAFISQLEEPDHPGKDLPLSAKAEHGKQLFQQASCNSCHTGDTFTDNKNHDVGTTSAVRPGGLGDKSMVLNTPSLLGVSRTWPYLHDGSVMTLKQRLMVDKDSNKHGTTKDLSDADMDDLVEYLKAL